MAPGSGAISAPSTPQPGTPGGSGPGSALARMAFRDGRIRTIAFAYLFAAYAYIQPAGYRQAYPSIASRVVFAQSFANNTGLRLFYGEPRDVAAVSGYTAWRVGGTLAIAAAAFGLLAAVRALRAEEDTGRMELVISGIVGRRTAYRSAVAACAVSVVVLWLGEFAGFVVAGLPTGGSAYLALATASVAVVFVGVGAIVSQLAPTRRIALELGGATVGLCVLLRVIADTSSLGGLRWATPLGWAEELRPFTGARPLVLVLPIASSLMLLAIAARIAEARDLGTGILPARDRGEPRLGLLSSPTAQAFRGARGTLIAWAGSVAMFAFILGIIAASVSSAGISSSVQREIAKLGSGSIATPSGYLAFVFSIFIVAMSLFACAQIGAARHEEAQQLLETLLAEPVSRTNWLGGRLLLAGSATTALAVMSGLLTWAGARSAGVSVSLSRMLEAGANCLPVALLFLGIAALAYAVLPRASSGIAYGLVAVAFVWQLVAALLGAPTWLADLTPFAHVGLVPTQSFRITDAVVMLAIGAASGLAAIGVFRHRDILGA